MLVVVYRRFGTTCRAISKGQIVQEECRVVVVGAVWKVSEPVGLDRGENGKGKHQNNKGKVKRGTRRGGRQKLRGNEECRRKRSCWDRGEK